MNQKKLSSSGYTLNLKKIKISVDYQLNLKPISDLGNRKYFINIREC